MSSGKVPSPSSSDSNKWSRHFLQIPEIEHNDKFRNHILVCVCAGGGTLIFSIYIGWADFMVVKIFNSDNFGCKLTILGRWRFLWIFLDGFFKI